MSPVTAKILLNTIMSKVQKKYKNKACVKVKNQILTFSLRILGQSHLHLQTFQHRVWTHNKQRKNKRMSSRRLKNADKNKSFFSKTHFQTSPSSSTQNSWNLWRKTQKKDKNKNNSHITDGHERIYICEAQKCNTHTFLHTVPRNK